MSPRHLYRVRVISFPEGSRTSVTYGLGTDWQETQMVPVPGWAPPGWRPEGNYVEILGTSEFVWPVANKTYHSRSTAKKRADLLNSFGAVAFVERSNLIVWPEAEDLS